MFYRRKKLQQANIKSAAELRATTNGKKGDRCRLCDYKTEAIHPILSD